MWFRPQTWTPGRLMNGLPAHSNGLAGMTGSMARVQVRREPPGVGSTAKHGNQSPPSWLRMRRTGKRREGGRRCSGDGAGAGESEDTGLQQSPHGPVVQCSINAQQQTHDHQNYTCADRLPRAPDFCICASGKRRLPQWRAICRGSSVNNARLRRRAAIGTPSRSSTTTAALNVLCLISLCRTTRGEREVYSVTRIPRSGVRSANSPLSDCQGPRSPPGGLGSPWLTPSATT